jgi:predicted nuclease of predicted toxin-antitoxin system
MAIKFFADQCVPGSVMESLRDAGHEVLRLRDYIRPDSSDPVVIAKAQELGALLISLDGDFMDIVTYPPARYQGIVALQVRGHPEVLPQLVSRLRAYLSEHPEMSDYAGRLLLIEPHRIRIRL